MRKLLLKGILPSLLIIAFIAILFNNLYSSSTGITGKTFKTGGEGCSCHGSASSAVTVTFLAADSVQAGTTKTIRLKIQGGPGVAGGLNVAAKNGVLNTILGSGVQKIGDELTHASPKNFTADTVSWSFTYTAPSTPGADTLYAVGNSVNLNGSTSGDQWNFRIRHAVKIFSPSSITNVNETAKNYSLSQNFPNPFNPVTSIKFSIPNNNFVTLKVYDILGNEIVTLINKNLRQGEYKVDFNASNYSSGIYVYKIIAGNFSETKRMTLVK